MMIINADDWGRSRKETDAALSCHREGRVTSVSAMVFLEDSERAATLAREHGVDAGLHLNLSQRYTRSPASPAAARAHERLVRFTTSSKYAVVFYHPGLRGDFVTVFQSQNEEFQRLYGQPASHVDGHQHRHLCANMLVDEVIPRGEKVRRNFFFWPGEKGILNRAYRKLFDRWLMQRYRMTEYFFDLAQCSNPARLQRVCNLARAASVELMVHPAVGDQSCFLLGARFAQAANGVKLGTYAAL